MFKITGLINGTEYTLSYKNGKLSGDDVAIKKAREENEKDHGLLGLVPAATRKDYLAEEIPAEQLCGMYVFDSVAIAVNNWDFTDVPEGSVF